MLIDELRKQTSQNLFNNCNLLLLKRSKDLAGHYYRSTRFLLNFDKLVTTLLRSRVVQSVHQLLAKQILANRAKGEI
ncbi:hypothetical protein LguiA_032110 [Lonicera macranthoides]